MFLPLLKKARVSFHLPCHILKPPWKQGGFFMQKNFKNFIKKVLTNSKKCVIL